MDNESWDNESRLFLYAFLSRIFSDVLSLKAVLDLQANTSLLEMLSQETLAWMTQTEQDVLVEELNVDYTTLFIMNAAPIESAVLDAKNEVLVGLENPVMNFYFTHGYDINLNQTKIVAPDHLAIELGFMQNLVMRGETMVQKQFMEEHLLPWVVPYLVGTKEAASTPFYRDFCDFAAEFLIADYEAILSVCDAYGA